MLDYYPLLILLAPLAAGVLVALPSRTIGPRASNIGVAAEVFAFALALWLLFDVTGSGPRTLQIAPWGNGVLHFALYLDRLSAVMLVHIAAISILIHLFSVRYMQQEHGYARFHSLLAFTTFVLFGMVSSANLLMLLVFWQLLSWLLPLLSYNYQHPPTVRGAFRTFIMQRFGDVAFLAAAVLAYGFYETFDLQQIFVRAVAVETTLAIGPGVEMRAATAVTLLIFVGAMAKSAQFPLHMWLPDSLYAPTPVHALLHAGIINAGGFLLARLAPLYGLSPATLHLVFAVGMLTALLGSSMMLVQSDIKKTLGYSTIGQMGFMIMECGVGAYGLAIFHLIAHGLFKGSIFLNCGYVIHAARKEPRLPPGNEAEESAGFSSLTWLTGFVTTLVLPLVIVLAAHGILDIPLRDSQGTAIFLFFGWATSSQAILTLYRLKAVASWKVAASMLSVLFVVVVTYLFAAESFTHFLFPIPGEVVSHFRNAALPAAAFDLLVAAFALVIIFGWFLIYARSHGRTFRTPRAWSLFQVKLYLFLLNRLYLDAVSMRLRRLFQARIDALDRSKAFFYATGVAAVLTALFFAPMPPELPVVDAVLMALGAVLLPLFPVHGVFVAAVTRAPGSRGAGLAVLLPATGVFLLAYSVPQMPSQIFSAVSVLALFGAFYGSLKALAQTRVPQLLAYSGLALYSALWWHVAGVGGLIPQSVVYVAAVALIIAGLLIAWRRAQRHCGNLTLERMHGLARPMPRFASIVGLLIMAAVGLPPFGLFFAHAAILLQPAARAPAGLIVMGLTWFLVSWYLFRMMQRLLFGSHRADIRYEDLRPRELASFALLLAILALLGATPPEWLGGGFVADGQRLAIERMLWLR